MRLARARLRRDRVRRRKRPHDVARGERELLPRGERRDLARQRVAALCVCVVVVVGVWPAAGREREGRGWGSAVSSAGSGQRTAARRRRRDGGRRGRWLQRRHVLSGRTQLLGGVEPRAQLCLVVRRHDVARRLEAEHRAAEEASQW